MASNGPITKDIYWIRVVATYLAAWTVLLIALLLFLWPSSSEAPDDSQASADSSIVVQGTLKPDSTLELVIITQPDGERIALDNADDPKTAMLDTTLVLVRPPGDNTVNGALLIGLILIVGALGSCLHALNSIGVFVGNKSFGSSWVLWYLLRPVTGALLAVIFLFVIKGGFGIEVKASNLYGIVAVAGLVGLFSRQAIDKLADLAETLFQTNKVYEDKLATKTVPAPVIEAFNPPSLTVGTPILAFTVTGSNFVEDSTVQVNDKDRETVFDSATQLTATLLDTDVAQAGTLQVKVVNPDDKGGSSDPKNYEVTATPPVGTENEFDDLDDSAVR